MKKHLTLFGILFLFPFFLQAQTGLKPLTVREVYDFNVGDVFEYEYILEFPSSTPNRFNKQWFSQKIIAKTALPDKLIYTIEEKTKTDDNQLYNRTFQDTIVNLDSSIFTQLPRPLVDEKVPINWIVRKDSTFLSSDFDGGIMSLHKIKTMVSVSGGYSESMAFMKGLGIVTNSASNLYPVDHYGQSIEINLVYYQKGTKKWGTAIDFTLKIVPYEPMVKEGAQWLYDISTSSDTLNVIQIKGDSTLGTNSYKKVFLHEFKYDKKNSSQFYPKYSATKKAMIGLIREDIATEKVYFRLINQQFKLGNCVQDEEFLLFDFNPKNNDTLKWCQLGNDKLIAGFQSIKMQYQDKFITSGFYTNKDRVLQKLGFADSYGIFYKKDRFQAYCVNAKLLCFVSVKVNDIYNDNPMQNLQILNNQCIIQLEYQRVSDNNNFKILCINSLGQVMEERKIDNLTENLIFSTPTNQLLIFVLYQGETPIGRAKTVVF
jgi:hypothetical protein